jgi:hypothetical protein
MTPKNPQFRLKEPVFKVSENDVESACLDVLRLRGYWPTRMHAGLFKSADGKRWIRGVEKGTPDWLAMRKPSFFVEVKRPGGVLSEIQKQRIFQLDKFFDLKTVVVEEVEELIDWLDHHQRSP